MTIDVAEQQEWLVVFAQGGSHRLVKVTAGVFIHAGHQLFEEVGHGRVWLGVVFVQFCQFGCFCHSIVKAAQLVHEFVLQGVLAKPHMTLCHGLHGIDAKLAAVGNTLAEQFVAALDICVQVTHLFLVEGARHGAEGTVLVGLHLVEL